MLRGSIIAAIALMAVVAPNILLAEDKVLVKFNNEQITSQAFETFLSSLPPERQKFLKENPASRRMVLERMVQTRLISVLARKDGLDRDAKVRMVIDNMTNEILTQEYIKAEQAKITVTDKDAEQYYKTHLDLFKVPEMVKARHILVKLDKASNDIEKMIAGARAKEKAESILARVRAGEDFAKLASEHSDDTASKAKGGDLGFFQKGKMAPAFESTAFSMKPGEVSDPVETKFGYHIIKLEEKKEASTEPFSAAKDKARERVLEELKKAKLDEIVKNALADAKVEYAEPAPPKPDRPKGPPPGSKVINIGK